MFAIPAAVSTFFSFIDETFGGLDILVNNAGIGIFRPVADLDFEDWKSHPGHQLERSVLLLQRRHTRASTARGGGSIINISSLAGKNPFAGGAAYNASKFGLNGFSEAMMLDHRNDQYPRDLCHAGQCRYGF